LLGWDQLVGPRRSDLLPIDGRRDGSTNLDVVERCHLGVQEDALHRLGGLPLGIRLPSRVGSVRDQIRDVELIDVVQISALELEPLA
jgi:hypothetical protein